MRIDYNMAHPPRIPVWLMGDQSVIYFVTLCENKRRPAWNNVTFFTAFQNAVQRLSDNNLWFIRSAIVMPDHLHLLASPLQTRDQKVGNLSAALKRWINAELPNRDWNWEPGAFDRLLRREENAQQKWEYMRANPVRAGFVVDWEDWPWSINLRYPHEKL
jgi:putative transposase